MDGELGMHLEVVSSIGGERGFGEGGDSAGLGNWLFSRFVDYWLSGQIRWPQPAMVWSGAWVPRQTEARSWW